MLKTGKPPSFSTVPISFHSLGSVINWCNQRENMRDHRIAYKLSKANIQKKFLRYMRCTARLGCHCIYGIYVVPPIIEGLRKILWFESMPTFCKEVVILYRQRPPLWIEVTATPSQLFTKRVQVFNSFSAKRFIIITTGRAPSLLGVATTKVRFLGIWVSVWVGHSVADVKPPQAVLPAA